MQQNNDVKKQEETVRAERKYKDTVFRMLFKDKERLLSLYNAINGSHYEDPEELEIVTLENAIYMNVKNDLAFLIDLQLHLYEHQSTVNPNMPLRFLQYISKEYEKLIDMKKLYMILSILVYTFFSRMFDLMLPSAVKHSIAVA